MKDNLGMKLVKEKTIKASIQDYKRDIEVQKSYFLEKIQYQQGYIDALKKILKIQLKIIKKEENWEWND